MGYEDEIKCGCRDDEFCEQCSVPEQRNPRFTEYRWHERLSFGSRAFWFSIGSMLMLHLNQDSFLAEVVTIPYVTEIGLVLFVVIFFMLVFGNRKHVVDGFFNELESHYRRIGKQKREQREK